MNINSFNDNSKKIFDYRLFYKFLFKIKKLLKLFKNVRL